MPLFNTKVLLNVNTIVFGMKAPIVLNSCDMKLGERLRLARKYAKLTQEELGDKAGCGQGVVSKIERGDQDNTAYVVKLAQACGVSITWLDSGEGEMLDETYVVLKDTIEYKVQQVMSQMDDRTKQQLLKIGNSLVEPEANGKTH